jgi:hypothetical protein
MSGGLIGSLLGLLVGPAADTEMAERSELMLLVMSRRVLPGTTALLADLDEPSPEVLETVMYKLGGTVTRQARAGVEAELEVAEEATRAAQREAERVMRERRKAEDHETLGDKLHDLKDKAAGA